MEFAFSGIYLSHLVPFCKIILEMYLRQQWKFQQRLVSCASPMSAKQSSHIDDVRIRRCDKNIMPIEANTRILPALEAILDILMDDSMAFHKELEHNCKNSLLEFLQKKLPQGAGGLPPDELEKFLKEIIPQEPPLLVCQLKPYLQRLHGLCGDLIVQTQIAEFVGPAPGDKDSEQQNIFPDAYQELVPAVIDGAENMNQEEDAEIAVPHLDTDESGSEDERDNNLFDSPLPSHAFSNSQTDAKYSKISGILNESKNCWLSSILQCLACDSSLLNIITTVLPRSKEDKQKTPFTCTLSETLNILACDDEVEPISIGKLYEKLLNINNKDPKNVKIEYGTQQSPHKFLLLLDSVLKTEGKGALLVRIMAKHMPQTIRIECVNSCGKNSIENHRIINLNLESHPQRKLKFTLQDLLYEFCHTKDNCKASKSCGAVLLDKTIVVADKENFSLIFGLNQSLGVDCSLDLSLAQPIDMKNFITLEDKAKEITEATGHIFATIHLSKKKRHLSKKKIDLDVSEHFFAHVSRGDEWFVADDTYVRPISPNAISTRDICLLFLRVNMKSVSRAKLRDPQSKRSGRDSPQPNRSTQNSPQPNRSTPKSPQPKQSDAKVVQPQNSTQPQPVAQPIQPSQNSHPPQRSAQDGSQQFPQGPHENQFYQQQSSFTSSTPDISHQQRASDQFSRSDVYQNPNPNLNHAGAYANMGYHNHGNPNQYFNPNMAYDNRTVQGYGNPNLGGYGNPNAGYGNPNIGYGNPNAGYGNPNAGYATPNAGYGNPNAGYAHPNAGYANTNVGYGNRTVQGYGNPNPGHNSNAGYVAPSVGYANPNAGNPNPNYNSGSPNPNANYNSGNPNPNANYNFGNPNPNANYNSGNSNPNANYNSGNPNPNANYGSR